MAAVVVAGCGGDGGSVLPAQTGCITGVVNHAGTGLPLGGIAVTAGGIATTTAADGTFTVCGVPLGDQQVVFTPAPERDLIMPPPNDPIVVRVVAGQTAALPGTVLIMDGPDLPPEPPA